MTLYDAAIITAIIVSFVGLVWASYALNKHRREIRIHRRIQVEAGSFFPSPPQWLKNSKWLIKLFSGTTKLD